MRRVLIVLLPALLAVLAACADKNADRPTKLVAFAATLRIEHVWSAKLGGTKVPLRLGLALSTQNGRVFAAGETGEVAAFDAKTGRRLWRTRTRLPLGGASGVDATQLVVGSTDGDVVALNPATGRQQWKVNLGSEILAAPTISARVVLQRTVDGKLHALSPADGHELWEQQQTVPQLSLRGTASPALAGELVVCGFDNGRVVASNLSDGSSVWESQLQLPQGKTAVQRLVDIDTTAQISGNYVYVVGYQGKVAMLALDSGQMWWSHDTSSYHSLAIDHDDLYLSEADGEVVALSRQTGEELWRQKALMNRGLSGPAVAGNAIVVADFQGYVHWLDKTTGALIGRTRAGKSRYTNPPLVVDDTVLLINDRGVINAFRSTPLSAAEISKAALEAQKAAAKAAAKDAKAAAKAAKKAAEPPVQPAQVHPPE